MRDNCDNCITVCNMENFDPLGVHTGTYTIIREYVCISNYDYINAFVFIFTGVQIYIHYCNEVIMLF